MFNFVAEESCSVIAFDKKDLRDQVSAVLRRLIDQLILLGSWDENTVRACRYLYFRGIWPTLLLCFTGQVCAVVVYD